MTEKRLINVEVTKEERPVQVVKVEVVKEERPVQVVKVARMDSSGGAAMLTDKMVFDFGERLGKEARENGCTEPQRGDYEALQEVVGAKDFAEVSDHIQRVFESGWKQA